MSKEKAIIIFTVAIDIIGMGIIIPVLPAYVESFGLSPFSMTVLISVYSLFSFISAPFLGALSDKLGRRPVLIASITSTCIGWVVFALAKGMPLLLLGRIIDGLAAGNMSTAQSSMTDLAKDEKERAENLGIIGMIFGLGFIVGPFIGGALSKVSNSFPFWFVAAMALINVLLAYIFLPETNKHIDQDKKININPIKPLLMAVNNKSMRKWYGLWLAICLIMVGSNNVFSLYLSKVFSYSPFQTGLFFTIIGVVIALNQGVLIKKFWLAKFKEKKLIKLMTGQYAFGLGIMTIPHIAAFGIGIILTSFAQSTLNVTMTSQIAGRADSKERGATMGILSSVTSVAMIVAPLIAGVAFEMKANLPYILGAIMSAILWVMIIRLTRSRTN